MSMKSARFIVAVAILASISIPAQFDRTHLLSAGNAWAGNGHGNGGGNGNGNAGGNGSANGNAGANSNGNSNTHPDNHGAIASSLGSLNAAHASATALANASPNSQVGKVAAYAKAGIAVQTAQNQLNTDTALLAANPSNTTLQGAVLADQAALQQAQQDQQTALNAAANKTPVSADTQAALDGLLDGKVVP